MLFGDLVQGNNVHFYSLLLLPSFILVDMLCKCLSVCYVCVVVFVSTAAWTVVLPQTSNPSPRLKATELAHQSDRRTQTCRFR